MDTQTSNAARRALSEQTNKTLGWVYTLGMLYGCGLILSFYLMGLDDPPRILRSVLASLICAWGSWQSHVKGNLEPPLLASVGLFILAHPFTEIEGQIFSSIIQCLFILLAYNIQPYYRARITAGIILASLAATPLYQSALLPSLYAQLVACMLFGTFIVDRSAKILLKIADETDASKRQAQTLISQAAAYEKDRALIENSFSSLLTSLPTPLSVHKSDGTPHVISDAFWDTLKVHEHARRKNQWCDLLPKESKAQIKTLLNNAKNSYHPIISEKPIPFVCRSSTYIMSACASRITSHQGELILISFHDITKHQELNESLARSNQAARASTAEAFAKNSELLEVQNKTKEMISSTSHELRTPLSLMHMILASNKHLTPTGEQQLTTAVTDAINTLDNLSLLNLNNRKAE